MATATRRRPQPATGWGESSACVPVEERQLLARWHPNVLLAGPPAAIEAALGSLRAVFRHPVVRWRAGGHLTLPPAASCRTLIIEEAASLTAVDQRQLFEWLQRADGAAQVVTTTSMPLLKLVDRGAFSSALYYALNVIYLEVSA